LTRWQTVWRKCWCWIGEQYWIDFIFDCISIGFVAWAVYLMIHSSMLASSVSYIQPAS